MLIGTLSLLCPGPARLPCQVKRLGLRKRPDRLKYKRRDRILQLRERDFSRIEPVAPHESCPLRSPAGNVPEFLLQRNWPALRKRRLAPLERRFDSLRKSSAVEIESLADRPQVVEVLHAAVCFAQHDHRLKFI